MKRVAGILMMVVGTAMAGVIGVICFHPSMVGNQLAIAIGIPGVLLGAIGAAFLLVEGETLVEGRRANTLGQSRPRRRRF
jgi:hypothetical protein